MSTRELFTGKAQNFSSAGRVSTRALAIVSLEQQIKCNIVLTDCLVGVVNGVLVVTA